MSEKKIVTTPGRSEIAFAAAQERRRSGAAGVHGDRRTKRQRDRAAQRRTAIKDADSGE